MFLIQLLMAGSQHRLPFRFTNKTIEKQGADYQRLTIYRANRDAIVWTKDFDTADFFPQWSPDGRKLSWMDDSWRVHVWEWKQGEKEFSMPNPFRPENGGTGEPPGFENYPMWSPDSKKFLLKVSGNQSGFDLQTGTLFYVDPVHDKTSIISWNACEVRWKNARTVEYWDKFYHELPQKPTVKHHQWHVGQKNFDGRATGSLLRTKHLPCSTKRPTTTCGGGR